MVEGANSFLRKTDLWWKFGVFPESDTPSIRFPLELSYKISNQMDGVKLIPESPFDKRGDLKNSFGYNSNIKSKISLVQEKVNQDILKLFIDAKTNEKIGLGLTKDFPVMKIKNLTQDWVTVEKLDVSDSGYLVLSIDLNQDNFFPSSYKEVRK